MNRVQKMIADQIAQNAITHPEWKQDDHNKALRDAGWNEDIVIQVSRVIAEAVLENRRRGLVRD